MAELILIRYTGGMKPTDTIEKLEPAATVLLIRDSTDGMEVFMVKRHHKMEFAGGALVFPGGKLDETDSDPGIRQYCGGSEYLSDAQLAMRIGGIRETFEESGVLLAREAGGTELLNGARSEALQPYRDRLNNGEVTIVDMAEVENIRYACDLMIPYGHWLTPPKFTRRYDTWFYLARAPEEQMASHDEGESTDSLWITPGQALEDAEERRRIFVFVTRINLKQLAESSNCAAAIAAAEKFDVRALSPEIEKTEDGAIFRIPKDAGYPVSEIFIPGDLL